MEKKIFLMAIAIFWGLNINAQGYELWGMTQQGGANNKGVIYKTDSTGNNQIVVYSFSDGSKPASSLLMTPDGKLYGMTSFGGVNDKGILFSFDTSSLTLTKHFDFSSSTGSNPRSSLMQASNGMLYGMTYADGTNGKGSIIEFNPLTNSTTATHHFGGSAGTPAEALGGVLLEASTGNLYGLTRKGGASNLGTLFKYELASHTVTKLVDFDGATTGDEPFGSLIQAANGGLYGMTSGGGTNNKGTIFSYDINLNVLSVDVHLENATGHSPYGSLMEAANGKLYGVTRLGTPSPTIFSFDPAMDSFSVLQNVASARGNLMQASNGKLYGTTYNNGLFEYDIIADSLSYKFNFTGTNGLYTLYGHLIEVSIATMLGITNNFTTNKIELYPNPVSDDIFISTDDNTVKNVTIYSLNGKLMLNSTEKKINVELLPSGVYIVVVETDQAKYSKKLVKK